MQYVTFRNGVKMPMVGIGTDRVRDEKECIQEITYALEAGYRMIDTAQFYDNEIFIGNAVKESGIDRKELYISTKLWYTYYEGDDPRRTLMESMERLGVDYLDQVMLHWPYGNYHNAWRKLQEMYDEGLIRVIGVSNMRPDRFMDLCAYSRIAPMINQVETNLFHQHIEEHQWMEKYGILHSAYTPLGLGKNGILEVPALLAIAQKYKKSPAQVSLRFLIDCGIPVIPKSVHKERIEENIDLFDFALTKEEIATLQKEDRNLPAIGNADDPVWAEHMLERVETKY